MKPNNLVVKSEIHGIRVDLHVDDPDVYEWFKDYLSGFLTSSEYPALVKFEFKIKPAEYLAVPEDAEWFLHYHGLAGLTTERFYYFRNFGAVMRFDPDRNLAEGTITEKLFENRRYLTHVFFTVVLFEALRYHGLYYIHSAALVGPEGEGLLIPANASSGKSTLCVALLRHGYRYVSDDAVFARWNGGRVEIVPFIREFHVSLRLAEVFKELEFLKGEPEYFPGNDKRGFRAEKVYPGKFLNIMGSPKVIIFPEIVSERESSIHPLNSQQALTSMIPNSALVMFSLPAARPHLEALKEMVCSARCFKLRSGRDVYEDPAAGVGRILGLLDLPTLRSETIS